MRKGTDEVIISRKNQISYAKETCLKMIEKGYVQKNQRKDITVLGKEGLGIVYAGANSMLSGNFMSEHDQIISEKLVDTNNVKSTPIVNPTYTIFLATNFP